jgi:hydrogenase maturation protease
MNPEHDERDGGADQPALLVLGLGNLLLTDDAVGLELLARLESDWPPGAGDPGVEFVDGGTQGLALLGVISGRRALLVLDAVGLGAAPGTVHSMSGEEVLAMHFTRPETAHDGGAGQLLALASLVGDLPERVTVVGVEPGRVATGVGFSDSVRAALPAAVARAKRAAIELRLPVVDAQAAAEAPCTN